MAQTCDLNLPKKKAQKSSINYSLGHPVYRHFLFLFLKYITVTPRLGQSIGADL